MKRLFSLYYFLITLNLSYAQSTIYKVWIGENLEYLKLTQEKAKFDYGHDLYDFEVKYKDSTLTLIDTYQQAGKIGWQHDKYKYNILKLSNDTLIISPQNDIAKGLLDNKDIFIFSDSSLLIKKEFIFQKIFFSSGPCYGTCPMIKIEIDSTGLVHFLGEYYTGDYIGLYKGQLNTEQLNRLIEILKLSEIDRFPTKSGLPFDAPLYNFKFYYNNKFKEFEGGYIPYFDRTLLDYMLEIYDKIKLEKIDGIYFFGQ